MCFRNLALITLFKFCFFASAWPQTSIAGGRGLLRVQSAQTVPQGSILVNSFFQTYFKNDLGGLRHDHTWNIGFTYGWTDNLELALHLTPYQDDQRHRYPPPGHSEVALKWHTPLSNSRFQTGVQGLVRLPTTKYNNVPFEPYSSDKVAWSIRGLLDFSPSGGVPLKFSANLGFMDHNIGTFLQQESTDQLVFAAGFKIAANAIIFYTEYSGEVFLNQPGLDFRNNSMRLTHGFKFRIPLDLIFDIGGDVGFSRLPESNIRFIHEYAKWRLFTGLTYHFVPKRTLKGISVARRRNHRLQDAALQKLRSRRENIDEEMQEMLDELHENKADKNKDENKDD